MFPPHQLSWKDQFYSETLVADAVLLPSAMQPRQTAASHPLQIQGSDAHVPHHFKCVPSSLLVLFCDEEDLLLGATPDQPHKGLVYCDGSVGGGGGEGEPEDHLLVVVSCERVLGGGGVAQSGETEWEEGTGAKQKGKKVKEKGRKTHTDMHTEMRGWSLTYFTH